MKKKWILFTLTVLLTVAADQAVKYLLEGKDCVLIPGVIDLTTSYNSGVAMSFLSGAPQRIIHLVSGLALLAGLFVTLHLARGGLALFSCGLILGGGLGNLIDRIVLGHVIDLFELTFVKFYIFNAADVAITCGAVLCGISVLFFAEKNWKKL